MPAEVVKLPLILTPEPEGGYIVTSPDLPELVTAGATVDEALENVRDALAAVLELYEDLGRPLPDLTRFSGSEAIVFEHLLATE